MTRVDHDRDGIFDDKAKAKAAARDPPISYAHSHTTMDDGDGIDDFVP